MFGDRRLRRSESAPDAIRFQLDAVARQLGAKALFIADPDGLLLGAASSGLDSEALAAYAPLLVRSGVDPAMQMRLLTGMADLKGASITVRSFDLLGEPFSLGAVTDTPLRERQRLDMDRAMTGVRRILRRRPGPRRRRVQAA